MVDINELQPILLAAGVIALPLVTGLTEVVKRVLGLGGEQLRWVPLIALVIGAIVGVVVISTSITGIVAGIIVGLGSTGLWEVGKTTIANK